LNEGLYLLLKSYYLRRTALVSCDSVRTYIVYVVASKIKVGH